MRTSVFGRAAVWCRRTLAPPKWRHHGAFPGPRKQGPGRRTAARQLSISCGCSEPLRPWQQRTHLLVGDQGIENLRNTKVLLVGLGGVGSFTAEFLVRAGVGSLTIVDADVVDVSNKNRQLPALDSTVGEAKADVVAKRLLDINPELDLNAKQVFVQPDSSLTDLVQSAGDLTYVVDAIDTIAPKCQLLETAVAMGIKVVSSMGAGGRLDPARVKIAMLSETHSDRLAKVVRQRLKKSGMDDKVVTVFSDEPLRLTSVAETDGAYKRSYYGTISYVPALFGLTIASYIVRDALGEPVEMYRRPNPGKKRKSSSKQRDKASRTVLPCEDRWSSFMSSGL